MCTADAGLDACHKALGAQKQTLKNMLSTAKAATHNSRKAAHKALKTALKAGAKENHAEHQLDEAVDEADRVENEAEQEADKARHRINSAFQKPLAEAKQAAKSAQVQNMGLAAMSRLTQYFPPFSVFGCMF